MESIARWFIPILMVWKLVPTLFPSPRSLSQIRWSENLFRNFFHRMKPFTKSDGAWKACSATFFHRPMVYLKPDGSKNLVLALFSIARKFISKPMDWKKLLFQDSSIAEGCFSASMVKHGKWIPSTKKFSQRRWSERPGSSLKSRGFPSWQKLLKRRWCLQPKVAGNPSIGTRII